MHAGTSEGLYKSNSKHRNSICLRDFCGVGVVVNRWAITLTFSKNRGWAMSQAWAMLRSSTVYPGVLIRVGLKRNWNLSFFLNGTGTVTSSFLKDVEGTGTGTSSFAKGKFSSFFSSFRYFRCEAISHNSSSPTNILHLINFILPT